MKFLALSVLASIFAQADMPSQINYASSLQVDSYQMQNSDDKIISPISPILGTSLVSKIRADNRHPEEIYNDIIEHNSDFKNKTALQVSAYFQTLQPSLNQYCQGRYMAELAGSSFKGLEAIEPSAIPTEVLADQMPYYLQNIQAQLKSSPNRTSQEIQSTALEVATLFQNDRYDCAQVKKIENISRTLNKVCLGFCKQLLEINNTVSSAEASFPRIQFSINGFTQYVYNQLLQKKDLLKLLRDSYDITAFWTAKKLSGQPYTTYFNYFASEMKNRGYSGDDILLILSYAYRNMPSLDVQYGFESEKALALEVYFWKLKPHRDLMSERWLRSIFPQPVFNKADVYHFATASLLACKVHQAGFSKQISLAMALASKIGYKSHKLITAIDYKKLKNDGVKYIADLAKKQGFEDGVKAGEQGGLFGIELCPPKQKLIPLEIENSPLMYMGI